MDRQTLFSYLQASYYRLEALKALSKPSPKAARRVGILDSGPEAAQEYENRHPPAFLGRTSTLRRLARAERIKLGERPLRYPTPTKREMTIARKAKRRAA